MLHIMSEPKIPIGMFLRGFLVSCCSCADGIKADVGKKYDGCATKYARPTILSKHACVLRYEWGEVVGVDVFETNDYKGQNYGYLERDHKVVEFRTASGASH